MITIATQCDDRKAMVRRLSEHLQTPAVYLYTPTYAFRIGEITVNRDASVSGEREALVDGHFAVAGHHVSGPVGVPQEHGLDFGAGGLSHALG